MSECSEGADAVSTLTRRQDRWIAPPADRSTFAPGMRLLPADVRSDVQRLYGVLRTLDDLVDGEDPRAAQRVDAVEHWARGREADTPETHTLADLAWKYPLSRSAVRLFCGGMRHDISRGELYTEGDLALYCQQAGGSVGIMLGCLLGSTGAAVESKLAVLGRAVQLTNILRDIDDDGARGRVYIDRETIARYGAPKPGAREALLRHLIAAADRLYAEGVTAIPLLKRGRRAVSLSAAIYQEILRQIEREGFGRQPGRVTVPSWRTLLLGAKHRLPLRNPA